ncbi:MAG TPA: hypothetical protein VMZ00_12420 [Sporichthya sp.]|nr:hypothetical protein [Sporichthya sp.]
MDPIAVQRAPSESDVQIRERCVLALFAVVIGCAVVFFGCGAVASFADFRPPVEVTGLPGIAALAALTICRRPTRRDLSLSRLILFASGLSLLAGLIGLIAWTSAVQGTYWALVLICAGSCLLLFSRWRTR